MKMIVDQYQMSEMGSGFGHFDFPEQTRLKQMLEWMEKNVREWGTVSIFRNDGRMIRCFDYDLYNKSIFYHCLGGWDYNLIVDKVTFEFCYMHNDISIYLK